jgi:hypothetical protein
LEKKELFLRSPPLVAYLWWSEKFRRSLLSRRHRAHGAVPHSRVRNNRNTCSVVTRSYCGVSIGNDRVVVELLCPANVWRPEQSCFSISRHVVGAALPHRGHQCVSLRDKDHCPEVGLTVGTHSNEVPKGSAGHCFCQVGWIYRHTHALQPIVAP